MNDTDLDRILNSWTVPEAPESLREGLLRRLPPPPQPRFLGIPVSWLPGMALLVGAAALAAWLIRDGVLTSDAGSWDEHTYVRRTRLVEPANRKLQWMLLGSRSTGWHWRDGRPAGSVHLYSRLNDTRYGYAWDAEPMGNNQYFFRVMPLDDGSLAPVPLPAPALIGAGSSFEITLYQSPAERVYDRIEWSAQPLSVKDTSDPAHESVTMTLIKPKLYINARFAGDSTGATEARGLTFRIDIPGRGRFVTALYSGGNSRFTRAGSVKGNSLEFEWAGELFRVECTGPISPSGDRPLFVMLQTGATGGAIVFSAGGAPNQYR